MREPLKKIEKEFDSFFEFDTDDKSSVTSASCKLFAEHCVGIVSDQYENEIEDNNELIKNLYRKANDRNLFLNTMKEMVIQRIECTAWYNFVSNKAEEHSPTNLREKSNGELLDLLQFAVEYSWQQDNYYRLR